MCPLCLATVALVAAGGTTAGGLAIGLAKRTNAKRAAANDASLARLLAKAQTPSG
jgi:hypothetical protein